MQADETDIDDLPVRAVRRALLELGRDVGPLGRLELILVACCAAQTAGVTLDRTLSAAEQEERLAESASAALRAAIDAAEATKKARVALIALIQTLPHDQQLVMSLRFEQDLNNREIASALGCSVEMVERLMTMALNHLRPGR